MPRLIDAETQEILVANLEIADRFWPRFKGLQFRHALGPEGGILLQPCSSIHTCFMHFPIDVVMLDQEMRILAVQSNVRPWRFVVCKQGTKSVIETEAGGRSWRVGRGLALQRRIERRVEKESP